MRLNELIVARPTLEKIANKEMNATSALEFAEYLRIVLALIQTFEMKRAELFQEYGAPPEKESEEAGPTSLRILPENEEVFNAAIKEALNEEIEVPAFDIANLGIEIAPADLVNVRGLFK